MSESPYETALRELSAHADNIKPSDVIFFSEPLRSALNFVIRLRRFALSTFAEKLGFTPEQTLQIANLLTERKLFHPQPETTETGETVYEARHSAPVRPLVKKPSNLWEKIE